jgi:hypothetical protein
LTTGNIDATDEMVDPGFRGYANGYPVFEPSDGNGPEQFNENIDFWSSTVPDLSIELYDELSEKGREKTERIAIRFVFTGTITAAGVEESFETEAAAFLTIIAGKLVEWRIVVDQDLLPRSASGDGPSVGYDGGGLRTRVLADWATYRPNSSRRWLEM